LTRNSTRSYREINLKCQNLSQNDLLIDQKIKQIGGSSFNVQKMAELIGQITEINSLLVLTDERDKQNMSLLGMNEKENNTTQENAQQVSQMM